jgi:mono/diheme cytochrome c family protein
MKKLGKVLPISALVLFLLLAAALTLTIGWRPIIGPKARPLTARTFESNPQRVARGHYLANAVSGCSYCHSEHDWSKPGQPIVPGREGVGEPVPFAGLPGRVIAPNLTPDVQTGTGAWTDDQLARAIREGIGHEGRALFPLMPYPRFRNMSDEDLASVIVYLRSLPPVRHELPATEIIFPVRYLIRNAPEPLTQPVPQLDSSDRVAWGNYLVTIGGCEDCHTPQDAHGQEIAAMNFSGGSVLEDPGAKAPRASVITTKRCS